MYVGQTIFSQLMAMLPIKKFRQCVAKYRGDHKVKSFTCRDQFLCMAFAQLTYRESLRDIEVCLRGMRHRLYHMGFRSQISRSTLADANEKREWRIYAEFAMYVINIARKLYQDDTFAIELAETVYALDSSTIDLCLSLFPWARSRRTKGAVKLHTLLDLRGNIPAFIQITDGKVHDVNILDELVPEPGAIYIMDRGYIDFKRLYRLHQANAYFVIRAKSNLRFRRLYSNKVDKKSGLKCDQTIRLVNFYQAKDYPEQIRRIRYLHQQDKKLFTFLTNNTVLSAEIIQQLYKNRWQIELFFKWIKSHLKIKRFYGTSENAVKTQIWIAITVYVLVAIAKKRLNLDISLYTFLQVLSVSQFEKVPILQLLTYGDYKNNNAQNHKQLNLFEL